VYESKIKRFIFGKHGKITAPLSASAILILIVSYMRYVITDTLTVDIVLPSRSNSAILFAIFTLAIALSAYGYYNAVIKSDSLLLFK